MHVRLIHVTQRRSGSKARREQILDTDRLSVGRGTDNAVPLSGLIVPLHHSLFTLAADGVYVEAVQRSDLRVNDRTTARQRLQPGDVVRVGQAELRVLPPAPGEDLALEVEQMALPAVELDGRPLPAQLGIERGWLTRRKLSWTAVLLVPALLLAVPLLARRTVAPTPASEKLATRLPLPPPPASRLQRIGLLIESSWSSGPLSTAHANLAGACVACHRIGYQPVRNEECLQCHPAIGHHARVAAHAASKDDSRCTSCHVEHEGDPGLLGFGSQMCSSCHADLQRAFPDNLLLDVGNFSQDHAEFRPSVVVDAVGPQRLRLSLEQLPQTVVPADTALQERSGLKFSHKKHLRPNLRAPQAQKVTLQCGDCHVAERAGELMLAPRFAEHCQSCHALSFDPAQPGRQVPHRQPQLIESYTFELYAGQVLQEQSQAPAADARRRPGKPMSAQERETALALAASRAAVANAYLLGPSGVCVLCHSLGEKNNAVAIAPVVLVPAAHAERWFPLAKFNHAAHTMAECRDCHAADAAESSGAVILPGIDACRKCHGDRGSADEVPSTCMKCHRYHHPDRGAKEG